MFGKIASGLGLSGAADLSADISADVSGGLSIATTAQGIATLVGEQTDRVSPAAVIDAQTANAPTRQATPPGKRAPDPWPQTNFNVEIKGVGKLRCQTVQNIGVKGSYVMGVPTVSTPGGNAGGPAILPPDHWEWAPLTIGKGMADDALGLWKWIMNTVSGQRIELHDIMIDLVKEDGTEVGMTLVFIKAYPTAWNIGQLNAKDSGIVFDTITFAHQGCTVDLKGGTRPYAATGTPDYAEAEKKQESAQKTKEQQKKAEEAKEKASAASGPGGTAGAPGQGKGGGGGAATPNGGSKGGSGSGGSGASKGPK